MKKEMPYMVRGQNPLLVALYFRRENTVKCTVTLPKPVYSISLEFPPQTTATAAAKYVVKINGLVYTWETPKGIPYCYHGENVILEKVRIPKGKITIEGYCSNPNPYARVIIYLYMPPSPEAKKAAEIIKKGLEKKPVVPISAGITKKGEVLITRPTKPVEEKPAVRVENIVDIIKKNAVPIGIVTFSALLILYGLLKK